MCLFIRISWTDLPVIFIGELGRATGVFLDWLKKLNRLTFLVLWHSCASKLVYYCVMVSIQPGEKY